MTDEDAGAVTRRRTAALFHCLADPMRLMILEHLKTGEHKVKELTEHLGLAQSTVSAIWRACAKATWSRPVRWGVPASTR
ncbi:ArsR family transcriptional regulator [Arthrobacter sp. JCM 19049]|uniref:ArsR family transcriptional regulator n=1 Tax=Arthrobacter sp. JCM 19049 TaxID=1460643 RepID=UPI0006CFDC85